MVAAIPAEVVVIPPDPKMVMLLLEDTEPALTDELLIKFSEGQVSTPEQVIPAKFKSKGERVVIFVADIIFAVAVPFNANKLVSMTPAHVTAPVPLRIRD